LPRTAAQRRGADQRRQVERRLDHSAIAQVNHSPRRFRLDIVASVHAAQVACDGARDDGAGRRFGHFQPYIERKGEKQKTRLAGLLDRQMIALPGAHHAAGDSRNEARQLLVAGEHLPDQRLRGGDQGARAHLDAVAGALGFHRDILGGKRGAEICRQQQRDRRARETPPHAA
jgi:hypothetical protein